LEIFKRYKIPIKGGPIETELTTPTGAAMLVNLFPEKITNYPEFIPEKIGYGTGVKEFKDIPNILRISIGKRDFFNNLKTDIVISLETNIDDIEGEIIGNLIEKLSTRNNHQIKDITIINGLTKKNRPSYILKVICSEESEKEVVKTIFEETGTLGIRKSITESYILDRVNLIIPIKIQEQEFIVNIKISKDINGKIINIKPEFEDIKKIAEKLDYPFKRTKEIINNLIAQRNLYDT
jgi:uncharacterized protein (DUF111 family)